MFAEIQNQKDARTRLEGEYKEQGEKLQAMNAVSPSESFVLLLFILHIVPPLFFCRVCCGWLTDSTSCIVTVVDGCTEIRHGHDAVRCIVVVGSVCVGVSGGGYYAACLRL